MPNLTIKLREYEPLELIDTDTGKVVTLRWSMLGGGRAGKMCKIHVFADTSIVVLRKKLGSKKERPEPEAKVEEHSKRNPIPTNEDKGEK